MQIEIFKTIHQKETINVEFPYYYVHDVGGDDYDSVIHGKIEKDSCVTIHINRHYRRDEASCKIEISKRGSNFDCYFDNKYKSSGKEFLDAKKKLFEFIEEMNKNED